MYGIRYADVELNAAPLPPFCSSHPAQFRRFARRSLGPFKSVPGRSTLTVYFPPTFPDERNVIVPF